jgi:hypothetical protein
VTVFVSLHATVFGARAEGTGEEVGAMLAVKEMSTNRMAKMMLMMFSLMFAELRPRMMPVSFMMISMSFMVLAAS